MVGDPDATVVLPRGRRRSAPPWLPATVLGLAAVLAWLAWQAWLAPLPPLASEVEILAQAPTATAASRFLPQPNIIVLHFASLTEQAGTFNRAAALLERAGTPRDRPLDDAALDQRIRAAGDTPERMYYGHDYRAADLMRFFTAVDRSGTALTAQERRLRRWMQDWGWQSGTNGAVISLVREDRAAGLDPAARATILRHELSHGLYFTSPDYARFVRGFWDGALTEFERDRFRAFLASEGYDTAIDDLVVNEAQAYLMHTANERFFSAAAVGIPAARIDALRALFLAGMPAGWLRDRTTLPIRAPRRRRQRRGLVCTTSTAAETRAPPRTARSRTARSSGR